MTGENFFIAFLLSSPLWTLISWVAGWASPTAATIAMVFAYLALALALLTAAAMSWASDKENPHG